MRKTVPAKAVYAKHCKDNPMIRVSIPSCLILNNQTECAQGRAVRVSYLLHTAKAQEWNVLLCSQHYHQYLGINCKACGYNRRYLDWSYTQGYTEYLCSVSGDPCEGGRHRHSVPADPCGNPPVQLYWYCFQPDWKRLLCYPCLLLSGNW